jgi:hypothetical protein
LTTAASGRAQSKKPGGIIQIQMLIQMTVDYGDQAKRLAL